MNHSGEIIKTVNTGKLVESRENTNNLHVGNRELGWNIFYGEYLKSFLMKWFRKDKISSFLTSYMLKLINDQNFESSPIGKSTYIIY